MSDVIILKDGKREYISSARDFADLLDSTLGSDARNYFVSIVDECDELDTFVYETKDRICEALYDMEKDMSVRLSNDQVEISDLSRYAEQLRKLMGYL